MGQSALTWSQRSGASPLYTPLPHPQPRSGQRDGNEDAALSCLFSASFWHCAHLQASFLPRAGSLSDCRQLIMERSSLPSMERDKRREGAEDYAAASSLLLARHKCRPPISDIGRREHPEHFCAWCGSGNFFSAWRTALWVNKFSLKRCGGERSVLASSRLSGLAKCYANSASAHASAIFGP